MGWVGRVPRTFLGMAAYPAEATLAASVESARGQTVEDLEVVVVDDGSPVPMAEALAHIRDDRLRIIRHDRNRKARRRATPPYAMRGRPSCRNLTRMTSGTPAI